MSESSHLSQSGETQLEVRSEQINAWLRTHSLLFLGAVTLLYAVSTAGYYHVKPADPDEVVYLWIVRMPGLHQIWQALLDGINIDPPFTQTLVHFLFRLFGESLTLARIPESIGFWAVCVGAYLLVSRYAPPVFAAAALFLPLASIIRSQGIETRPYGVMLGCAMMALVCWDSASTHARRGRWLAGLAVAVALCVSSHFFGTVLLFPLAVGELFKLYWRRRADWGCGLAIAAGASPLFAWLPILRAAAATYGKHYFGRLSGDSLYLFYNNLLLLAGFIFLLLLACAVLAFTGLRLKPITHMTDQNRALLMVAAAFLCIPVLGYVYAVLISHFFVPKYLMLSVFGVILGVPLVASLISGRSLVVGLLLLLAAGGHGLFVFSRGTSGFLRGNARNVGLADLEGAGPRTQGDVVVASAILFETLVDAGGPGSDRLIYLYDPEKAVRYSGTDSSDLVLKALNGRSPARFDTYDHYAETHPQFYILTAGPVAGVNEWIMTHLTHHSAHLQFTKSADIFDMYLVTLPAFQ